MNLSLSLSPRISPVKTVESLSPNIKDDRIAFTRCLENLSPRAARFSKLFFSDILPLSYSVIRRRKRRVEKEIKLKVDR